MKALLVALVVIVVLVVAVGAWAVGVYNNLVGLDQGVSEKWAQVQNVYQRRADLIPNLVETVKGYAAHERETFDAITAQRAAATSAGNVAATAQADAAMTGLLGRLMAVAEAYPELKADANFRQLQGELSAIETELQSARRYYNATARDLNTKVVSFPDMFFAGPLGFKEEPYYEDADPAIQSAPKVEFQRP